MQGREYDLELEETGNDEQLKSKLSDALAEYFERKNDGEKVDTTAFIQKWPEIKTELVQAIMLLQLPERARQTTTEEAWRRFKGEIFTQQPLNVAQLDTSSLGGYVTVAIQQNDQALSSTGLPRTTLEALSHDVTPLTALQSYQFEDYARLAKRYDVKNDLFPRMLKWLKGLSKNLNPSASTSFGGRGMVFARDENTTGDLTEAELIQALEQEDKSQEGNS